MLVFLAGQTGVLILVMRLLLGKRQKQKP